MAKVLDGFDFTTVRTGRSASYPWAEWFDGQVRLLTQGETEEDDFDYGRENEEATQKRAESFVSGMRTAFGKMQEKGEIPENKSLKTSVVNSEGQPSGDRVHVVVQVVDREGKKRGRRKGKATETPADSE